MKKGAEMWNLIQPYLRLGLIGAAAAAIVVTASLLLEPLAASREKRAESELVQSLAPGAEIGERRASFPLTITRSQLGDILALFPGQAGRLKVENCYEPGPEGTMTLKHNLTADGLDGLSTALESVKYKNSGPVRAYQRVARAGVPAGFLVELEGKGFGGTMSLLALYAPDGTLQNAVFQSHRENLLKPDEAGGSRLLGVFAGRKGSGVPVSRSMLTRADIDAVSGATDTFRGAGVALRAGSLFVFRLGEN
jgi:hypothetical protein